MLSRIISTVVLLSGLPLLAHAAPTYKIYVTNERSGDVTVIDGDNFTVSATIPVGKRPRGIHVSPDGSTVYVALSGTPVGEPPKLDAQGAPILTKQDDDEDDDAKADKAADGIGMIDVASGAVKGKLNVGSDPEEFALSRDGSRLYISNEDVKTASVINIAAAKIEHLIPVGQEPEGVTTAPDGKSFYVTCEAGGEIFVIDTASYKIVGHFTVKGRPRSVAFMKDTAIGFIPSESAGELNVIDTAKYTVLKAITLPKGSRPMRALLGIDGRKLYVSNGRAGTISVFDTGSYQLLSTVKVGQRPWGISLSPDGKYLFSANGPSNDVSVVDLVTYTEISRVKAGSSPWGLAVVSTPN